MKIVYNGRKVPLIIAKTMMKPVEASLRGKKGTITLSEDSVRFGNERWDFQDILEVSIAGSRALMTLKSGEEMEFVLEP